MRAVSLLSILAAHGVLASPPPRVTPATSLEQRGFGGPAIDYGGDDNEYRDELDPTGLGRTVYVTKNRHRPSTKTLVRPRPKKAPFQHLSKQDAQFRKCPLECPLECSPKCPTKCPLECCPKCPTKCPLECSPKCPTKCPLKCPTECPMVCPPKGIKQLQQVCHCAVNCPVNCPVIVPTLFNCPPPPANGGGNYGKAHLETLGVAPGGCGAVAGSSGTGTSSSSAGIGGGGIITGSGTGGAGSGGSGSGGGAIEAVTGNGTRTGGGCAGACTSLQVIANPSFDAATPPWTFAGTNGAMANLFTTVGIVSPGGALASAAFTFLPAGTTSGTPQSAAISQHVAVCENSTYLLSFSTYVNQGISTDSMTTSPIALAFVDIVHSLVGTTAGVVSVPLAVLFNCQIAAAIGPSGGVATHTPTFPFASIVGGLLTPNIALGSANMGWNPNTYHFKTAPGETVDLVTLTATCPGLLTAIDPTSRLGNLLANMSGLASITLTYVLGPDLLRLAGLANVQIYVDNVTLNLVNACF
jgi:hypothetical protein